MAKKGAKKVEDEDELEVEVEVDDQPEREPLETPDADEAADPEVPTKPGTPVPAPTPGAPADPPPKATGPKATLGRVVFYRLTGPDAEHINATRKPLGALPVPGWNAGAQPCYGNPVGGGDAVLALVTRSLTGETYVNLKVLLDGTDTYWVRSVYEGQGMGCWSWPPKV